MALPYSTRCMCRSKPWVTVGFPYLDFVTYTFFSRGCDLGQYNGLVLGFNAHDLTDWSVPPFLDSFTYTYTCCSPTHHVVGLFCSHTHSISLIQTLKVRVTQLVHACTVLGGGRGEGWLPIIVIGLHPQRKAGSGMWLVQVLPLCVFMLHFVSTPSYILARRYNQQYILLL